MDSGFVNVFVQKQQDYIVELLSKFMMSETKATVLEQQVQSLNAVEAKNKELAEQLEAMKKALEESQINLKETTNKYNIVDGEIKALRHVRSKLEADINNITQSHIEEKAKLEADIQRLENSYTQAKAEAKQVIQDLTKRLNSDLK